MPVTIKGSGGGSVTLDAGAAAADTTLTIPNVTGTVLQSGTAVTVAQGGTGAATLTANAVLIGNGTSAVTAVAPSTAGNVLTSNGTTWASTTPSVPTPSAIGQIPFSTNGSTYTATQKITQGTAVASTSGTAIDFTGIPSWVKRVTVMFSGVSTSGSSNVQIQVGSGSFTTTGYAGTCLEAISGGTSIGANNSTGFVIHNDINGTILAYGSVVLNSFTGNTWIQVGTVGRAATSGSFSGGSVSLSGVFDRVRITTVNGTDTFDAGSINILYE